MNVCTKWLSTALLGAILVAGENFLEARSAFQMASFYRLSPEMTKIYIEVDGLRLNAIADLKSRFSKVPAHAWEKAARRVDKLKEGSRDSLGCNMPAFHLSTLEVPNFSFTNYELFLQQLTAYAKKALAYRGLNECLFSIPLEPSNAFDRSILGYASLPPLACHYSLIGNKVEAFISGQKKATVFLHANELFKNYNASDYQWMSEQVVHHEITHILEGHQYEAVMYGLLINKYYHKKSRLDIIFGFLEAPDKFVEEYQAMIEKHKVDLVILGKTGEYMAELLPSMLFPHIAKKMLASCRRAVSSNCSSIERWAWTDTHPSRAELLPWLERIVAVHDGSFPVSIVQQR